jgi:hypothetical protein
MGKLIDLLRGGKSDRIPPSAFPPKKVEQGAKVESEHTTNKTLAKEITRDHLSEDMDYYEKLRKMEKQASFQAAIASFGMELEKLAKEEKEPFYKRHKGKLIAGAAAAGALGVGAYLKKKGLITFEKTKVPVKPVSAPQVHAPHPPAVRKPSPKPPTPQAPKSRRKPDLTVRMKDMDAAIDKAFVGSPAPKRTKFQERLFAEAAKKNPAASRLVVRKKKTGSAMMYALSHLAYELS